jgi:hypothetical protein
MYAKSMRLSENVPEQKDNCILPRIIWQRLVENQTTEVLLVEILQRDTRIVLCVDSYHNDPRGRDHIYIPDCFLTDIDPNHHVEVNVLEEMPPIATKIVLEPLDTDLDSYDITTSASEYLSNWNLLKKNQVLSIPCADLGGYVMEVLVKDVEPQELVLLRGEVPFEIYREEPVAPVPAPVPVAPQPFLPPAEAAEDFNDFLSFLPQPQPQQTKAFTGRGYRLGS